MARVVLVDDDAEFSYAIGSFLTASGHDVIRFGDPIAALEELESERAVHLLVSDVKLGQGMPHGIALARMARVRRPNLPVVLMTGFPAVADQDRSPPGPVLVKPFPLSDLATAISGQLSTAP